jgi:hypothetical protein
MLLEGCSVALLKWRAGLDFWRAIWCVIIIREFIFIVIVEL